MTTIGDRIRRERRKQGFSQERLSRGICSQSSLSRLEDNNVNLSVMKVNRILERLNLSFNDLMASERMIREDIFTDELDASRNRQDYDRMARILDAQGGEDQEAGEKFKMYVKWHRGLVSFHKKDFEDSRKQLHHAIYIADKYKYNSYMPHLYVAMGNTSSFLGERPLKYYVDADETYRTLKVSDFRLKTDILYHIILCHSNEGHHHQAILKCQKAVEILNLNFSTYMMCEIYDLWLKALAALNEKELYSELRHRTHIIFEHQSRLEMWEKLENYPLMNI